MMLLLFGRHRTNLHCCASCKHVGLSFLTVGECKSSRLACCMMRVLLLLDHTDDDDDRDRASFAACKPSCVDESWTSVGMVGESYGFGGENICLMSIEILDLK